MVCHKDNTAATAMTNAFYSKSYTSIKLINKTTWIRFFLPLLQPENQTFTLLAKIWVVCSCYIRNSVNLMLWIINSLGFLQQRALSEGRDTSWPCTGVLGLLCGFGVFFQCRICQSPPSSLSAVKALHTISRFLNWFLEKKLPPEFVLWVFFWTMMCVWSCLRNCTQKPLQAQTNP